MIATTCDVSQQIHEIQQSVERLQGAELEIIGTASPGDTVRQGDLLLVCLAELPAGRPAETRQLAPGTTQGSRHVAEGLCRVSHSANPAQIVAAINRLVRGAVVLAPLVGPVVECYGVTTITHPEHGHKQLPAETVWAVVYQRQYAEEVRRVVD